MLPVSVCSCSIEALVSLRKTFCANEERFCHRSCHSAAEHSAAPQNALTVNPAALPTFPIANSPALGLTRAAHERTLPPLVDTPFESRFRDARFRTRNGVTAHSFSHFVRPLPPEQGLSSHRRLRPLCR